MSLIQKLQKIKEIKENIKGAIMEKGGALEDATPFSDYAEVIQGISAGDEDFYIDNISLLFTGGSRDSCIDVLIKHIDWSKITKIQNAFKEVKVSTLDFSNADTSNITNMYGLFNNCLNLENLNISSFDTRNVTDMAYMFANLKKISSIDLSNFNFSNATSLNYMFHGCEKLTTLIADFNTVKAKNLELMFYDCYLLNKVKINISNATNARYMFSGCGNLKELDFTGTENVLIDLNLASTALTRDGLMKMLSTLPKLDHSQIIELYYKKNLLSEEDIAEFAAKGYTIA